MGAESSLYAALGASSSKAGMLKSLNLGKTSTYFAQPIPDVTGDPDYFSVLHADGAGTKSIIAYLAYKETGDISWFKSLAQDSLIMNLDDIACIGAFESLSLSNTIGRNRNRVPDEAIGEIVKGYNDLCLLLKEHGININMAGGETADMGDVIQTLVIDSTLFARVKRNEIISTEKICSGDVIIGLSSTGRSTYESVENSGIGSNGLTLARHALIHPKYAEKYPEILDATIDKSKAYRGKLSIFDKLPGSELSIAEALLSPTRTYAPVIKKAKTALAGDLHAVIHCSGGALTKSLRFGQSKHYIKNNLFKDPAIFSFIQETLEVPWNEMYAVFNMGQRMEVYCPESRAQEIIDISKSYGIEAQKIGYVEDSKGENQITINSSHGSFEYKA